MIPPVHGRLGGSAWHKEQRQAFGAFTRHLNREKDALTTDRDAYRQTIAQALALYDAWMHCKDVAVSHIADILRAALPQEVRGG